MQEFIVSVMIFGHIVKEDLIIYYLSMAMFLLGS